MFEYHLQPVRHAGLIVMGISTALHLFFLTLITFLVLTRTKLTLLGETGPRFRNCTVKILARSSRPREHLLIRKSKDGRKKWIRKHHGETQRVSRNCGWRGRQICEDFESSLIASSRRQERTATIHDVWKLRSEYGKEEPCRGRRRRC
jgi:hypothetical protein